MEILRALTSLINPNEYLWLHQRFSLWEIPQCQELKKNNQFKLVFRKHAIVYYSTKTDDSLKKNTVDCVLNIFNNRYFLRNHPTKEVIIVQYAAYLLQYWEKVNLRSSDNAFVLQITLLKERNLFEEGNLYKEIQQ